MSSHACSSVRQRLFIRSTWWQLEHLRSRVFALRVDPSLDWTSWAKKVGREDPKDMKQSAEATNVNSDQTLAWRRLLLTRGKLKASSRTSALMSGFAMVAMVEIQLEEEIPEGLLIAFSVMTTVLISVHVFALMISVCILPNIESVSAVQQFVPRARIRDSPHEHLHFYIEMAWIFSTGLGTLLFLAEIAILCWVKFYEFSTKAAIAASAVLVPVCIVFVLFAVHFYRSLAKHNCERSSHDIEELQQLANQLNTATSTPAPSPPMVSHHRV